MSGAASNYTKVTCTYVVNATGAKTAAQIATAMSSLLVPVPTWISLLFGATVLTDNTTVASNVVTRTIVFTLNSTFQVRFANATAPFFGIMTGLIRAAINQPVLEGLPTPSSS